MPQRVKTTLRLLCLLLSVLLMPGRVELFTAVMGDDGRVVSSLADKCCDGNSEVHGQAEDQQESAGGCTLACEDCWCCASLSALPSLLPSLEAELFFYASSESHPGMDSGVPPARLVPPPIRPPIS